MGVRSMFQKIKIKKFFYLTVFFQKEAGEEKLKQDEISILKVHSKPLTT